MRQLMSRSDTMIFRALFIAAGLLSAAVLGPQVAHAVSADVKSACKSDYFQHCSGYAIDSQELRQCMRKIGENLSTPCLVALVKAGEVTKEDIARYKAGQAAGSAKSAAGTAAAAPAKSAGKPARTAAPKRNAAKATTARKSDDKKPAKSAKPEQAKNKPSKNKPSPRATANAKAPSKASKVAPQASRPPQVAGWTSDGAKPGAAPAFTHNLCRATTLTGEVETYTCGLDEKCCYGALFNEKYCVPMSQSCF